MDLQHINTINVSTQSETTTTRKSHGSGPNSEREFIARARRLHGSSAYIMQKKRLTHGSGGECSISTKKSRSRSIVNSTIANLLRVRFLSLRGHLGSRRKSSLVLESKWTSPRPNRPQSSLYNELGRIAGTTVLKSKGASPRHAAPCLRRRRSLSWAGREDRAPSIWHS